LQPDKKLGTIGSAGALIPGIVAKVVKSNGSLAMEGEQGELVVTGPSMALGYYENPTAYVSRHPVCCEYPITHLYFIALPRPLLMVGYEREMKSSSKILKCLSLID